MSEDQLLLSGEEDSEEGRDLDFDADERPSKIQRCVDGWKNSPENFKWSILTSLQVAGWAAVLVASVVYTNAQHRDDQGNVVFPSDEQDTRAYLAKYGVNLYRWIPNFPNEFPMPLNMIGMYVLYILMANLGATIQSAWGGLFGLTCAYLMNVLLGVMFGGGNTCRFTVADGNRTELYTHQPLDGATELVPCDTDDTVKFVFISLAGITYISIFLFFQFNGTVRFFAIGNFLYYYMPYLDPTTSPSTYPVSEYVSYIIAALIACLSMAFPKPFTARGRVHTMIENTVDGTFDLKRKVLEYATREKPSLDIYDLQSRIRNLDTTGDQCKALAQDAWWESCWCSLKSWYLTNELADLVDKLIDLVEPMFGLLIQEDFKPSHKQIMAEIEEPLSDAMNGVKGLTEEMSQAMISGTMDEDDSVREDLDDKREENVEKIRRASRSVKVAAGRYSSFVSPETSSEHFMVYTTCISGKTLEQTLELEPPASTRLGAPRKWCSSVFDLSLLKAECWPCKWTWAKRTLVSLLLAGIIGFHGWSNCKPTDVACSPFLAPYNAAPAYYVVVFMGTSKGSKISGALTRISAVVLSTIAAQFLWVFFGFCDPISRLGTVLSSFAVVFLGMYILTTGGDWASLGQRLAATCLYIVWRPCSDKASTHKDYDGYFHDLIYVVTGVMVLTIVDLLFGDQSASDQAQSAISAIAKDYQELLNNYLTTDMSYEECDEKTSKLKSDLLAARSLSDIAVTEPAFYRQPWRQGLYNVIVDAYMGFVRNLSNLNTQVGDQKGDCLLNYEASGELAERILNSAKKTREAMEYTLNGASKTFLEEPLDTSADDEILNRIRQQMNEALQKDPEAFKEEKSGESRTTRQCVVTVTLEAMLREHPVAQQKIVNSQRL